MKNQVCRDCSERTVNCHSTCAQYKNECAEREKQLRDYRKHRVTLMYVEEKIFREKH